MPEYKADLNNISEEELRELYEKLLEEKKQLEEDRVSIDQKINRSRRRTIDLFGKMIDVKKAQKIIEWQNEELEAKNKEINQQKKSIERTYQKFRERTIDLFGKMIDLKKAYKIIQFQNEEIEKQRKLLHESNISKDKFFSILAHDLKNPIAGFLGMTEMMAKKKSDLSSDIQEAFTESLYENSKQLYSLLENLLNWARSQTGSIHLEKKVYPLDELITDVISQVNTNAQLKHVNINTNIPDLKIIADSDTLKTVVRNLLSNAIKFSKPGGSINIQAQKTDCFVSLTITDFGVGMSNEQISKLFKIEHTLTQVGTANEKGTGLGLILCKEFMELNGGSIKAASEVNKGSTFTIAIPVI